GARRTVFSLSSRFAPGLLVAFTAYLKTTGFALLSLSYRQRNFQNAIAKAGVGILSLGAFRHRNSAIESAVAALTAEITFALFLVFVPALAFNRDSIVSDFDVHIVSG